jgi:hypothetical protein
VPKAGISCKNRLAAAGPVEGSLFCTRHLQWEGIWQARQLQTRISSKVLVTRSEDMASMIGRLAAILPVQAVVRLVPLQLILKLKKFAGERRKRSRPPAGQPM